ncbi:MAG: dienelactone hydrolase family protein [Flavitalea sp.]
MKVSKNTIISLMTIMIIASCNDQSEAGKTSAEDNQKPVSIKEESASFQLDSVTSQSVVYYNENSSGKSPIVVVIPEWWGLNDYPKSRAKQLAEMGYIAMAVDMYGNGKIVDNPNDAGAMSGPFYQDPQMAMNRVNAAIAKAKSLPQADTTQVAAIGYCFGGGVLLNAARLGLNVNGVVSFHGSLIGTPVKKDLLKSQILVCHGLADPFVPEEQAAAFRKSMDSINAEYTFKAYPDAMHAFTNPNATETGKKFNIPIAYNAAADSASWQDMKVFFGKIFTTNR